MRIYFSITLISYFSISRSCWFNLVLINRSNKQTTNIASSYSSSSSSSENVVMDSQQITNFAASSSYSSSSVMSLKNYDVFLSFRGEDTRYNFTHHLYVALQKKVGTYIDNMLEKGDEISQALIKAIQGSLISIVIFSENYASSKWCLDEISMILECKKDRGQVVIPVFYKVDPSHVRKQTGSYKEAFAKHEQDLKGHSDDKLKKWRRALTEAANLAGWDSRNRHESQFIEDIVTDVLKKLNIRDPIELKGVIGIEENYAEIESLLDIGSTDVVRVIGIWGGMGGAGKTTLARALYAKLFHQFEGHCFLNNVREQSEKNGLDFLRTRLFSHFLEEENLHVDSDFVIRRLRCRKVLIVLDDVATSGQLEDLIGDFNSLAPGSRVIVTTRDKHILTLMNDIYEVKELNQHASLHLFCLNAFGERFPKIGYEKLAQSVIAYCKGNPLALKVLGVRLRSKSIEAWESEWRMLQKFPDVRIYNVLKLSFDDLDPTEKDIFLDIACFFKGKSRDDVTSLLDACGFFATVGIQNLIDKSLLTVSEIGNIEMHDLIQEMGRNVVRQESDKDPGRRSRLWDHDEVCRVLKYNKGTEAVECIILDVSKIEKDIHLSSYSFTKMSNIRILKFCYPESWRLSSWLDWAKGCKIYLRNGLESLPDKLKHLEWHGYCLKSLPSTFCAENLVKLDMRGSNLKKLWDGVQELVNLKEIDLSWSKDLVELPDLSQATNLIVLNLTMCISLLEVHPSVLSLHTLCRLYLRGCAKIESLETENHLKSLREIDLSDCSSLKKFSVSSEKLSSLELDGTNIQVLPTSIWQCEKLASLSLNGCYSLESFGSKSSHGMLMRSLWSLDLSGCKLVNESNLCLILDGMRSLTWLELEDCCNLRGLPDNIGTLTSLQSLRLSRSINVEMLSPNIKNLLNLQWLYLDNCRKLVSLPELPPSLQQLSAINCTSLVHTDYSTQLLPMLDHSIIPQHKWTRAIFPGSQIPEMFRFRGEGDSVTFPQLPQCGSICNLICCLVLSHIPPDYDGEVHCYIDNKRSTSISVADVSGLSFISDHVFVCSATSNKDGLLDYWKTHHLNTITFEFRYSTEGSRLMDNKIEIKRCGVFPVYDSQDQQQTITTVLTEGHGCKRKSPSFKKEENSRPEKHIIPFDTSSASNINLNQSIEVSGEKDLSNNQVEKCSVEKPYWDPNLKAILEKLEILLDTSFEIISSNDEVKQQFHQVLEQLGHFEDEVPVKLHPVICKLKTLIKRFEFRFATSQKTIQDYDQLLQSRSLLAKKLESVKAQQDQIKIKVSECKVQLENIHSEIGEQEKESSVLVEDRDRLKRELDYYEAEDSKLKAHVAQWMPECKTVFTALKNSETAYKVAVTNKTKYEDEWAHLKMNFVAANKF